MARSKKQTIQRSVIKPLVVGKASFTRTVRESELRESYEAEITLTEAVIAELEKIVQRWKDQTGCVAKVDLTSTFHDLPNRVAKFSYRVQPLAFPGNAFQSQMGGLLIECLQETIERRVKRMEQGDSQERITHS